MVCRPTIPGGPEGTGKDLMRALHFGLFLLGISATAPALAQGFPGSTFGRNAPGVPANPFASNYPSEPPPARIRRERVYGSGIHGRGRYARRARTAPLRPPADIPQAGSAR
ncbi:hypothetical protein GCM10007884_08970 [Methylobacterium brachythecii]|uniref:Uncharacterized protein n=1 Tax=Methylobacterium brachythecii TaxID=1176177 RepID=A0ABQ6CXT8_9HYPH|nr:hypothetical protein GCM10007884_08970 [Methylobacterium brachythecii]